MLAIIRFFIWCFSSLSLMGCKGFTELQTGLDQWTFGFIGGTLFSEPYQVTTKQLHFDTGELFGQDVVLEGKIESINEVFTFLTLSDKDGKVLVVLTQIEDSYQTLAIAINHPVKILGRLERGKKGLPYLLARSVRLMGRSS